MNFQHKKKFLQLPSGFNVTNGQFETDLLLNCIYEYFIY